MGSREREVPGRGYEVVDPVTDLQDSEDAVTLLVYLPGFEKADLNLQLTTTPSLWLTGTRKGVGKSAWKRVQKEYPLSRGCDPDRITADFEDGVLRIKQPRKLLSQRGQEGGDGAPNTRDKSSGGRGIGGGGGGRGSETSMEVGEEKRSRGGGETSMEVGEEKRSRGGGEKSGKGDDDGSAALMGRTVRAAAGMSLNLVLLSLLLIVLLVGIFVGNFVLSVSPRHN
ncbi:hypothetical protein NMG60_11033515 [Bertholletia excelsa]